MIAPAVYFLRSLVRSFLLQSVEISPSTIPPVVKVSLLHSSSLLLASIASEDAFLRVPMTLE